AMILAAGRCPIGLESTVLDLTTDRPTLLRPGAVTQEELAQLLGTEIELAAEGGAVKAPGMLTSHYAPDRPVRLDASSAGESEAVLAFGPDRFMLGGRERLNLSPTGDLHEAAANLFAMLRTLDR